jgi:hypothetical protein
MLIGEGVGPISLIVWIGKGVGLLLGWAPILGTGVLFSAKGTGALFSVKGAGVLFSAKGTGVLFSTLGAGVLLAAILWFSLTSMSRLALTSVSLNWIVTIYNTC